MPQAVKSSAWLAQFLKSNGLIWPSLRATGPTAGRPGLSGTLLKYEEHEGEHGVKSKKTVMV
jgi:hypothetical protein